MRDHFLDSFLMMIHFQGHLDWDHDSQSSPNEDHLTELDPGIKDMEDFVIRRMNLPKWTVHKRIRVYF